MLSGEWLCGVVALCCAEVRGGLTLLCAGAAVLTRCIGGGGVLTAIYSYSAVGVAGAACVLLCVDSWVSYSCVLV